MPVRRRGSVTRRDRMTEVAAVSLSTAQVRLSQRMSMVLRHRPESAGIALDTQGWGPVPTLLEALGITRAELDAVVAGNDKSRFAAVLTIPAGEMAATGHVFHRSANA